MNQQPVRTVKIKGKDYVDVAERVRLCLADEGYSMLSEEALEIAGVPVIQITIDVKGKHYIGTAEIKVNAKPGTADHDSPIACGETSALGRALGFAGYGVVDSIASADEVASNQQQQSNGHRTAQPLHNGDGSPATLAPKSKNLLPVYPDALNDLLLEFARLCPEWCAKRKMWHMDIVRSVLTIATDQAFPNAFSEDDIHRFELYVESKREKATSGK